MIDIRNADGALIASATETDPHLVALSDVTRYYVAWSGDCSPVASGELVARVTFSSKLAVDMPIGGFRPSCVTGTGQSISMYADEPGN